MSKVHMPTIIAACVASLVSGCQTTGTGPVVAPGASGYLKNYLAAPGYKALAGVEHQGGYVYRASTGKASLRFAADEAMEKCNRDRMLYGQIVSCRMFMLNQTSVRGMSDAEVEQVMTRESAAPPPARTDWPHIDEALEKYTPLPGLKAMAGAVDPDGAYSYSWRSSMRTMDAARTGAVAACEIQKQKLSIETECRVLFEGDQDVFAPDGASQEGLGAIPDHQRDVMLYLPSFGKTNGRVVVRGGRGAFTTSNGSDNCAGSIQYSDSTYGTWEARCGNKTMNGQFRDHPSGYFGTGSATTSSRSVASIEFGPREPLNDEGLQSTSTAHQSKTAEGLAAGTWGGKIVTGSITTTDPKANQGRITLDLGTVQCQGQWTIKPGSSSGLVAAGCGGDLSLTGSYAREADKTYAFDGTDSRGQKVVLKGKF